MADVLDEVSKVIGRPLKPLGTVPTVTPKTTEPSPFKPQEASAQNPTPLKTQQNQTGTNQRPSLDQLLGRKVEPLKLEPIVSARYQMYDTALKNGFTPEVALKTAMEEASVMTPDPSNWRKFTSYLAHLPTGTGETFGDIGWKLNKLEASAMEGLHRAWSNPLGASDEETQQMQKSISGYLESIDRAHLGNGALGQAVSRFDQSMTGTVLGQLSPINMAILLSFGAEGSLAKTALESGIKGAVPAVRTLTALVQSHFVASALEGAASGLENLWKGAWNGDWGLAGEGAAEALTGFTMSHFAVNHEVAESRVRGDLEKTAREMYGQPPGGPIGSNLGSRFDSLDSFRQGMVIHETVQRNPEYKKFVEDAEKLKDKERKARLKTITDYHDRAISQAYEPNVARRTVRNIDKSINRRAAMDYADSESRAEDAVSSAIEEARQHYIRQIVSTLRAANANREVADQEQREEEEQARQEGREARPQRKAEERQRKFVILTNAEQTRKARMDAVDIRDKADRQKTSAEDANTRQVDAHISEDGHVSYQAQYYGETNSFGVAGDENHIGVYRETPRGTEYLTKWGTYSDKPEDAYIAPDQKTAETIAKISSLRFHAESLAEQEGKNSAHHEESAFLAALERDLVSGEKTADEAIKEANLSDKTELPTEVDALRSGNLKGPLYEKSEVEFLSDIQREAEAAQMSLEDTEALLQSAGISIRAETENNLHHVTRSGDYIESSKGVRWTLDSRGMLHPDDGSAPVPLLKNGRYSGQVIDLARSGKVGWASETREQRRARMAKERAVRDAITPELKRSIDEAIDIAQQLKESLDQAVEVAIDEEQFRQKQAPQKEGLLLLPGEMPTPGDPTKLLEQRRARQAVRQHYREQREKDQKAAEQLAALIQEQLEKSGAKELIDHIAKGNGLTPEEVVRIQLADRSSIEGAIAGLEPGDKITDRFRPDHPWVVEQRSDGKYELVSRGARIPLDRLNPSENIKRLVREGEIRSEHPISEDEVRRAAFEAPYIVRRNELVNEVNDIEIGKKNIPDPTTPAQASAQLAAAQRRTDAAMSNAADAQANALNPTPGTSESEADENAKKAEDAIRTAEAAARQEAEAFGKTVPEDAFPARAPISIGRRGNSGVIKQNGKEYAIHYEMVPLGAVVTSHVWEGNRLVVNPEFTKELQPRTINKYQAIRTAVRGAIRQPGATEGYDFDLYADRTIGGSTGPALIEPGGRVVGGNRRLAIMRKYLQNIAEMTDADNREVALALFREDMNRLAREHGITPPEDGQDYVVVRVLDEPIDTLQKAAELGRLFNKSVSEEMSADAKGVSYAKSLTDENVGTIGRLIEDHDGLLPAIAANPEYFARLVTDRFGITEEEFSGWFEPEEENKPLTLSEAGKKKFSKAMLRTIFTDSQVLEKIYGETPYRAIERAVSNLIRLRAIADKNITQKIIEAVAASAQTMDTDVSRSASRDPWVATYRPEKVAIPGMEEPTPLEPGRMTEVLWRALHGSKAASPRVFNDRLNALIGSDSASIVSMFGEVHETPAEVFNRVFAKEFAEVAHSRRDPPNAFRGITQQEYDAALQNVEFSDAMRDDAIRAEEGKPPKEEDGKVETHPIIDAVTKLESRPGNYVPVSKLREAVPGITDADIWKLVREGKLVVGHYDGPLEPDMSEYLQNPNDPNDYYIAIARPRESIGTKKSNVLTPPPTAPSTPVTPEAALSDAKAKKGYVTPEELKTFLESHPETKKHAQTILRTARLMAELVFDRDPPEGRNRSEALAWVLEQRLTGVELVDKIEIPGTKKLARGGYSDPLIEKGMGTGILRMSQAAEATTFLHEFAHVVFPMLSKEDMETLNTMLDAKDRVDLKKGLKGSNYKRLSEAFAHGLEKFLRDENPKGFSANVAKLMSDVKQIFRKVYLAWKTDPLIKVNLSEPARQLYAEMFHIEEFDVADRWHDEVEKAKKKTGLLKGPLEDAHQVSKLAKEIGADGIRDGKNYAGKVDDTIGDRVDPKKPIAVLRFTDIGKAAVAWAHLYDSGSKIQDAEFVLGEDGTYGIRFNTPDGKPLPDSILYQESESAEDDKAFRKMVRERLNQARENYDVFKPESIREYNEALEQYKLSTAVGLKEFLQSNMGQIRNSGDMKDIEELRKIAGDIPELNEMTPLEKAKMEAEEASQRLKEAGERARTVSINNDKEWSAAQVEWRKALDKAEQTDKAYRKLLKDRLGKRGTLDPLDPSILHQELPRKHPGIELEELKKKLAATPASSPMIRKLYQLQIQNLENEIRAKYGVEERKPVDVTETAKAAIEEKNATTGKQTVPGLRGLPERTAGNIRSQSTGAVLKPAVLGGPNDAGVRRTGGPLPGTRQLTGADPVRLEPLPERGQPVGILHGSAFDAKQFEEGLENAGLPKNTPPFTVTISRETAQVLKYAGQKQIVQAALSALRNGDGFVLASGTGTGKTFTSSAIIKEFINANPAAKVLYITKNADLLAAGDSSFKGVAKNSFGLEVQTNVPRVKPDKGVYGTTYQRILGESFYQNTDWDLVIADECGEMRNWFSNDSKQGKAAMAVIDKSKKAVYVSATPWHSPMEVGYAKKLGLWPPGQFEKWIADNFRHEKIGNKVFARLDPGKQAILRNQLVERGQFISQAISYDGFTTHFGVVPITEETRRSLNRIHEGIARAKAHLETTGKKGLAGRLAAFEAVYTKTYLERTRVGEAIQLAKQARAQGWNVMIFSEYTAQDLFRRPLLNDKGEEIEEAGTYRKLDQEMGGELSRIIPEFGNVYDDLKKAFGDDIVDFSGGQNTDATRQAAKRNFNNGTKPMIYTTYAAGGIGHSFDDTDGNRPRLSIFLGPPYSGVVLDQSLGRTWRFGTNSDARAVFLATDSEPDIRLMATKIGPRMRALRASVQGERDALGQLMANYTEEQKQREQQDLLAYDQGNEVTVDANSFQKRVGRKIDIDNWSQITFPHADTAKNKGMKIQVAGNGDDWATLYQEDMPKRRQFNRPPPTFEEMAARKKINDIAKATVEGKGLPPSEPIMQVDPADKETFVGASSAVASSEASIPVERDQAAVARMAMERMLLNPLTRNKFRWNQETLSYEYSGTPMEFADEMARVKKLQEEPAENHRVGYLPIFTNQEVAIRDIGYQSNSIEPAKKIVNMQQSFAADKGVKAAEYISLALDAFREVKLDPKDPHAMAQVWDVAGGETVSADPKINHVAQSLSALHEIIHSEAAEAGVAVMTPEGEEKAFKDFPSKPNWMPVFHDWDAELEDPSTGKVYTLKEVMGQTFDEKQRERILKKKLADSKAKLGYEDYINELKKSKRLRVPVLGHMHRTRELNFPIIKKDWASLVRYYDQAAEAISLEKNFGHGLKLLNKEIGKIKSENGQRAISGMFRSLLTPEHDADSFTGKLYNNMTTFEMMSKMTLSAIKVPWHVVHAPLAMGTKFTPVLKAGVEFLKNPKEFMEHAAYVGTVTREVNPYLLLGDAPITGFAHEVLTYSGFDMFYKWGRALAGASSRIYLEQYALKDLMKFDRMRRETSGTPAASNFRGEDLVRRVVKDNLLIGDHAIDQAIARGSWAKEDLDKAEVAFANMVMFSEHNSLQMPTLARLNTEHSWLNNTLRMTYALQTFAVKETSFLRQHLFDEVVIHRNFKPLIWAIVAEPILGQALTAMTAMAKGGIQRLDEQVSGKKHDEDPWDKYLALIKDDYDHGVLGTIRFVVDGMAASLALDRMKRYGDAILDAMMGEQKEARASVTHWWQDELEEASGPDWTTLVWTPIQEMSQEANTLIGHKNPAKDQKWHDTQANFWKWMIKEFPILREEPHVKEWASKSAAAEPQPVYSRRLGPRRHRRL